MTAEHKRRDEHQHHHRHESSHKREHRADHDENHGRQPAEAGVQTDTRWGDEEESFDIRGSILRIEEVRGGSRITISRGRADGVHLGMEGYLDGGRGMLADFSVDKVDKRYCTATVNVRPEDLQHVTAIVNPSQGMSRAASAKEQQSRILRVTVSEGRSHMVIAGGTDRGYAVGMTGQIGGAHFELEKVDVRSSEASTNLSPDALQRHSTVTIHGVK